MKFRLLILFVLLVSSNLFSQNTNYPSEKQLFSPSATTEKLKDSIVSFVWNSTFNYWALSWKENYSNVNNKLIQTIGYEVDSVNFILSRSWRYTYTYDNTNNVSQWISNDWVSNFWVNYCKAVYTYNTNNKISQILGYDYFATTLAWIPSWKETYTYTQQQNISQWIIYDWNTTSNIWVNSWKADYNYLTNNKDDSYVYSNWNTANAQWEEYEKGEYSYGLGNNVIELTISERVNNLWTITSREVFTDDTKSTSTSRIAYKWDSQNLMWIFSWKNVYYWNNTTNSISDINTDNNVSVYPNPCTEFVNIKINSSNSEFKDVELFNAIGQKISIDNLIEFNSENTFKIDLTGIIAGVYFLRINIDNNIYSEIFILK